MGAITDVVKRYVPRSYTSVLAASSFGYGITELQALADFVQFRLFATVPGAGNEAAVWNPKQAEYIGIVTTLNFIPAAVDYWADQLQTEVETGTNESVTYRDPRPMLWKTYEVLQAQAAVLAGELGVAGTKGALPRVSYADNGRGILITPDPAAYPKAWDELGLSAFIPWGAPE